MKRTRILELILTLVGLAFPASLRAQGVVTGQETTISYTGSNVPIVQPNTPVSRFNSPNGTNTFIIPLSNPTTSIRVYITNNTANACSNAFTAQLWAASDPQVSSFNNSLANWQVIPMQSTAGTLVQALNPVLPASGAVYFSSAVISAPKVALQLVSTSGVCLSTNVEVTGVVSSISVTSPLVTANSPSSFNGLSTQVQGIVAQLQSAGAVNPVVVAGVELPVNANFQTIGVDNTSAGFAAVPNGSAGNFTIATVPAPTQPREFAVAFEASQGDVGTGTNILAPWTNVSFLSGCNGAPNLCADQLPNVVTNQKLVRSYSNSAPGGTSNAIIVLSSSPATFVRAANLRSANANVSFSPATSAGDTLLFAVRCSGVTVCGVSGITDTLALSWKKLNSISTPGASGISEEVWAATTLSPGGADSLTVTLAGTADGAIALALAGTTPALLTTPAVDTAVDPIGDQIVRQDAQNPNFFTCNVTLSINTTTQCQAAPTTINNVPVSLYVTDIQIQTTVAGVGTAIQLKSGTGTNCGTGTANLSAITYSDVATGLQGVIGPRTPLIAPPQTAVCVTQAGTTAGTAVVELRGFLAP